MKRFLLLALLMAASLSAHAQFGLISFGAPTGSCSTNTLAIDTTNNVVYSCGASGVWASLGTTVGGTQLVLNGSTSGAATVKPTAIAGTPTITLPATSITVSGAKAFNCGTTTTCANTVAAAPHFIWGQCTASAATTCVVASISPAYTGTTSYSCSVTDMTTAANNALTVTNTSTSSFTITTTSSSDTFAYICVGT